MTQGEKFEAWLKEKYPDLKVGRYDRDGWYLLNMEFERETNPVGDFTWEIVESE